MECSPRERIGGRTETSLLEQADLSGEDLWQILERLAELEDLYRENTGNWEEAVVDLREGIHDLKKKMKAKVVLASISMFSD